MMYRHRARRHLADVDVRAVIGEADDGATETTKEKW